MAIQYERSGKYLYRNFIDNDGIQNVKFWLAVIPGFGSGMTIKDAESEAERIRQTINNYDQAIELLAEARNQIEYLHRKFQETGSGNNVVTRIEIFL